MNDISNPISENRRGSFKITIDEMLEKDDAYKLVMSLMYVIRAECFHPNIIIYDAYSHLFEISGPGVLPPKYELEIKVIEGSPVIEAKVLKLPDSF